MRIVPRDSGDAFHGAVLAHHDARLGNIQLNGAPFAPIAGE
jgi:hypothetical protein